MWVCALYFPSLSMYINIRGSLYRVCLLLGVCRWVLRDIFFFVFTSWYLLLESEMSDFLLRALGHCSFHHYIHCWCDFTSYFDLSWSSFISIYSLFHHHPHYCFRFIPFISPLVIFLQRPIPNLLFSLYRSYTSHYQFDFLHCLIITIILT